MSKISSNGGYLYIFFIIFTQQFAFHIQSDSNLAILNYNDFKIRGNLIAQSVINNRKLLLINFDAFQRQKFPDLHNDSVAFDCSSPVVWFDRYKLDRFDQSRDLILFYSFTVLERCVEWFNTRLDGKFTTDMSRIYLFLYRDGSHHAAEYRNVLNEIVKRISVKGAKISYFLPEQADQDLHSLLRSLNDVASSNPSLPELTILSWDGSTSVKNFFAVNCEFESLPQYLTANDPLAASTGGGSSTLIPSNESLLNSFSRTSVLFVSVSFIILMVISLAWLVFYYVQRFRANHAKDRMNRRLANTARKILAKEPTKTLKFGDKELEADCPVCIEPYRCSDVVRVVPSCRHIFHKTCVDPWLLEHRTCPMCKSDLLKAHGYNIGHHMADIDHFSTGGHSTDGTLGHHHHHRSSDHHHHRHRRSGAGNVDIGSYGSGGTLNGYAIGVATDSDLHDPFFPSSAPSPSMLQPVLRQADTQAFSIIPLTVHSVAPPPPPTITVRPATCPSSSEILAYNIPNVVNDNFATSSDEDSINKPLFTKSTEGRFRSAQTGRRRLVQQQHRNGAAAAALTSSSVDEGSLSRAIFQATKNVVGRLNTPRSSSSHDLCFVRRNNGPPSDSPRHRRSNNGRSFTIVDPSSPRYFAASLSPRRVSTCALRAYGGGGNATPSLESL